MNEILLEDYKQIASAEYIPWEKLQDKTILVTGACGLIGSTLVNALLYANEAQKLNLKVIALDISKTVFAERFETNSALGFIEASVEQLPKIEKDIDYIVHAASPTASKYFVEHPVETINIAVNGTRNMLELAKQKKVDAFVYLSSMEVYGSPEKEEELYENSATNVDTASVRSCYPEAKRLCENLCTCYCAEYAVSARVVRLAQTFGAGVSKNDGRVFMQFAKAAMEGKDIVLQTQGTSKRPYLYTADAVSAVLTVLLCGADGEIYNAANLDNYCSIYEMAQLVATEIAQEQIDVRVDIDESNLAKYPPASMLKLNVDKLKLLGWKPIVLLVEMFNRMIENI